MMPGGANGLDDVQAARDGWRLVQLARLARDVEGLARGIRQLLEPFDADELVAAGGARLDAGARGALVDEVCALRDAAEQAGMIGGDLAPEHDALDVPLEAVGEAAVEALTEGSADVALILLASSVVHRDAGFPALAEGIEVDPIGHIGQWGDVTIGALLGAFRGADARVTAWVCASARVSADATWTSLDMDALARVTWALRHVPAR
jgi:hypothetical protein